MAVCIEKCWNCIRLRDDRLFFALGLGAILLLMLITWSKGGDAQWYSHEHDQYVINSVLAARHDIVFNEFQVVPEYLNGVLATSIHHDPFGSFLFYYFLPARTAFFGHLFFCTLIAYIGMFLCLRDFAGGGKPLLAAVVSFLFATLPVTSSYGVNCLGIPLVLWAIINVCRADNYKKIIFYSCFILLFAFFSSLTLTGFGVLILLGIGVCVFLLRHKTAPALRLIYSAVLLLIGYIPANIMFYLSVLIPARTAEVSHRVEFDFSKLSQQLDFFKRTCGLFILGQYHAASMHIFILLFVCMLCALVFFLPCFFKKAVISEYVKKTYKILIIIISAAFAIAVFYGFYRFSAIGLELRAKYLPGAMRTFGLARIHWFYPAMFYIAAGLGFELLWRLVADQKGVISDRLYRRCRIGAVAVICCVAVATLLYSALAKENVLFLNVRTLFYDVSAKNRNAGNINNMTWDEYWAVDLFEQAAKDIPEAKDKFRVISIGMSPEPALYNGFYALDAYSFHYPLSYKHKFRRIIADELELNPMWKTYFDYWGGRVYAFSHELGFLRYHKSKDVKIHNFCFNLKAFKDMGGKYIFSGVEIVNPEKYGLTLLGTYESEKSFYRLRLYRCDLNE